jgi:hypothetical protein
MKKRQHPEVDGHDVNSLYTFEFKKRGQTLRDRLIWASGGLVLGVGIAIGAYFALPVVEGRSPLRPLTDTAPSPDADNDAFEHGIQNAMKAAQDTQSAESKEEWISVAMLWQHAISAMQQVPSSNTNYAVAQQKVSEYQRNLDYAQSNVQTRASDGLNTVEFWSLGSSRSMVMRVQGTPSRIARYDALCKETLYYGGSSVELTNGQVSQYNDSSSNLKVLLTAEPSQIIVQGDRLFWTLGSSKDDVLSIEGAPTRINSYEFIEKELYHYDDAWVEFEKNIVTGYSNIRDRLQVAIDRTSSSAQQMPSTQTNSTWSLGSNRDDVLRIQQMVPTKVSRNQANCEEIVYYGESQVEFTNGLVSGYDNAENTLRVR